MAIRNSLNPIHAVTLAAGIATAALSGAALARDWDCPRGHRPCDYPDYRHGHGYGYGYGYGYGMGAG
jgi:hypothetical protein